MLSTHKGKSVNDKHQIVYMIGQNVKYTHFFKSLA